MVSSVFGGLLDANAGVPTRTGDAAGHDLPLLERTSSGASTGASVLLERAPSGTAAGLLVGLEHCDSGGSISGLDGPARLERASSSSGTELLEHTSSASGDVLLFGVGSGGGGVGGGATDLLGLPLGSPMEGSGGSSLWMGSPLLVGENTQKSGGGNSQSTQDSFLM